MFNFLKRKYKYKGMKVVVLQDFGKLVKIQNVETKQILKVQRHLVKGLK